ncbi:MAG: hypothetical protein EA339_14630 [Rhodobacteraceae bacterium]|nr:MAG: hypothetical protein EA339_14630 [Paracoccaceae bacterium]
MRAMAENLVNLDGERSREDRNAAELRRACQKACNVAPMHHPARDLELRSALQEGPADNWKDAASKARFLLGRFAQTPQGQEERIQKLIQRALCDFARLIKREERKSE